MKDNFSSHAQDYARYRPAYPPAFFEYLNTLIPTKLNAWDCGTGNGQVAIELAKSFEQVYASDISQSQLDNALKAPNIHYSLQAAEHTNFSDHQFDLVIVAQAIHWFDFEKFYAEVKRTAKAGALICVIGYGLIKISPEIDKLIADFYTNIIGPYWDKERKYIDEHYQTIPFPFTEIDTPEFENKLKWSPDHLMGYINTWSAVKHFIEQQGYNPVEELKNKIGKYWNNGEIMDVRFPLLLRIGMITTA